MLGAIWIWRGSNEDTRAVRQDGDKNASETRKSVAPRRGAGRARALPTAAYLVSSAMERREESRQRARRRRSSGRRAETERQGRWKAVGGRAMAAAMAAAAGAGAGTTGEDEKQEA